MRLGYLFYGTNCRKLAVAFTIIIFGNFEYRRGNFRLAQQQSTTVFSEQLKFPVLGIDQRQFSR